MDREKIPPLAPKRYCCYSISDQSRNRGRKEKMLHLKKLASLISHIKKTRLLKEVQPCYHVQQQRQVRDSSPPVLVWLLHAKPIQKCRSTSSTDMTLWDSEASRHCPAKQSFKVVSSSFLLKHLWKLMPKSSLVCFVILFVFFTEVSGFFPVWMNWSTVRITPRV